MLKKEGKEFLKKSPLDFYHQGVAVDNCDMFLVFYFSCFWGFFPLYIGEIILFYILFFSLNS